MSGFSSGISPHRHPFPARPAPRRRGSPLPRSAQRPHLMTRKFNPLWLIGVCEFWLNSVNIYISRFYKRRRGCRHLRSWSNFVRLAVVRRRTSLKRLKLTSETRLRRQRDARASDCSPLFLLSYHSSRLLSYHGLVLMRFIWSTRSKCAKFRCI